jgi:hypothetical protein
LALEFIGKVIDAFRSIVDGMKKNYLVCILILMYATAQSQGWEKIITEMDRVGDNGSSQQMLRAADGNFVVLSHQSLSSSQNGIYLIKINAAGSILWSKFFPHAGYSQSVIELADGYLISSSAIPRARLIKTDLQGNLVWSKTYSNMWQFSNMLQTPTGILLYGQSGNSTYQQGAVIAKIDEQGDYMWYHALNNTSLLARGLVLSPDGGFAAVATLPSNTYGSGSICYLMKFDDNGNVQWSRGYTYSTQFAPSKILVTADNHYLIAGAKLIKTDLAGNIVFVRGLYPTIKDIYPDGNNTYAVLMGDYWNDTQIRLGKMTEDGSTLWTVAWSTSSSWSPNYQNTVLTTADGGYIIAGYHNNNDPSRGLYLIKTDSAGSTGCNTQPRDMTTRSFYDALCVVSSPNVGFISYTSAITDFPALQPSTATHVSVTNQCCNAKASMDWGELICAGAPFHICGGGAPHISWSTGDTSACITTPDTIVTLTVSNSCGSFSRTDTIHPGSAPTLTYSLDKDSICPGDSVTVHLTGHAPYFGVGPESGPWSSVTRVNDTLYILKPATTTTFDLRIWTSEHGPSCSWTYPFVIHVTPDKPVVTWQHDTLVSSLASNYQWLHNGVIIPNATASYFVPHFEGGYSVRTTAPNGCMNVSDTVIYTIDVTSYSHHAWEKVITPSPGANCQVTCMVKTNDGSYVIASNSQSPATYYTMNIIKTDSSGHVLWSKTYGGTTSTGQERINSIIETASGYVAVGSTKSFGSGDLDVFVMNLNKFGGLIWSKAYGDWNTQVGVAIRQTLDMNYVVLGSTTNPNAYLINGDGWLIPTNDIYLFKIDGQGNMLWNKRYSSGYDNEMPKELLVTSDGGFMIGSALQKPYGNWTHNYFNILKTDNAGNLQWNKAFADTSIHPGVSLRAMKPLSGNKFLLAGYLWYYKTVLIKIDESGNIEWSRMLDLNSGMQAMEVNSNDEAFIASLNYYGGIYLAKLNQFGKFVKGTSFHNDRGILNFTALHPEADGSVSLAGTLNHSSYYWSEPSYISLVRTDEELLTNCSEEFYAEALPMPLSQVSITMSITSLGQQSNANPVAYNFTFSDSTFCRSAEMESRTAARSISFSSGIYPNPTTGKLIVNTGTDNCCLSIYNTMGEKVFTHSLKQGANHVDLSLYDKGVYFFELTAGNAKEMHKVVLN